MCLDSLKASGMFLVSTAYTVHTIINTIGYPNAITYDVLMNDEQTSIFDSRLG